MRKYKLKAKIRSANDDARWYEVGVLIIDDPTQKISIKLDLIPAVGWDGWINAFPIDKKEE